MATALSRPGRQTVRRSLLASILLVFLLAGGLSAAEPVTVDFFYQPGCNECAKVKALVLPRLAERFAGRYVLNHYDIGITENYLKLVELQDALQIDDNEPVAIVLDRRLYLGGFTAIDRRLLFEVENCLQTPATAAPPPAGGPADADNAAVYNRAAAFTLGAVAAAGLVDGINPCVFSTLIFFLSLLAVARIRGSQLLWVGSVYCFACFLTYLALGFGLFRALQLFSGYQTLQRLIESAMILLLLLFAGLSLLDAIRFRRTRNAAAVKLQLPAAVKRRIHTVMRRGLAYRYLLPGAFLIGVLVTVLESVCTGQVYLPTLVLLTKEQGAGRWLWYLLLYNVMFILPLLAVFAIAYRGVTTSGLLQWSRRNVFWGKLALAGLFTALAALLCLL